MISPAAVPVAGSHGRGPHWYILKIQLPLPELEVVKHGSESYTLPTPSVSSDIDTRNW